MALSIVNNHICHSKLDNLIEYLYFTKAVTVSVRDTKTGLTYHMTQELLPGQKPGRKGKVHHISTQEYRQVFVFNGNPDKCFTNESKIFDMSKDTQLDCFFQFRTIT